MAGIAVALLIAVSILRESGTQPSTPGRPHPDYWGAEIGPQFTGRPAPFDMQALRAFQSAVGKAPAVVAFNLPFENCGGNTCAVEGFPATQMSELRAYGSIPFLNWSSQSSPLSPDQPGYRLAVVASGSFDRYLEHFAREAKAWGHPFFLRFDWEMNRSWFPWGESANGNRAGDFVRAWRHVYDIFARIGATNATWVWCPYVAPSDTTNDLKGLYPGDRYVDWTCLDGYNFGASAAGSSPWQTFATLFAPSYREITRDIAPSKPMIIAEVASVERGGSKALWIRDMLTEIPRRFPRIRGVLWFDAENLQAGTRDATLPLESSRASLDAFSSAVGNATYPINRFGHLAGSPIQPPA